MEIPGCGGGQVVCAQMQCCYRSLRGATPNNLNARKIRQNDRRAPAIGIREEFDMPQSGRTPRTNDQASYRQDKSPHS